MVLSDLKMFQTWLVIHGAEESEEEENLQCTTFRKLLQIEGEKTKKGWFFNLKREEYMI